MTIWEKEYYALRLHYIQLHFPALSPAEAKEAARKDARTYLPTYPQGCQDRFLSSIERCFQHLRSTKRELDRTHLTHRNISLAGKTFRLSSPDRKGFYNTDRSNPISTFICLGINGLIRISGKAGFLFAPFITLHLQSDNKGR